MGPKGSMFEGKTLDDAVRKGLDNLGLSRAEAMINVVEEGSGGFLGFGAKPYKVIIMPRPGGPPRDDEGDRDRDRDRRGGRSKREGARDGRRGRSEGSSSRGERNGRGRRVTEGRSDEGSGAETREGSESRSGERSRGGARSRGGERSRSGARGRGGERSRDEQSSAPTRETREKEVREERPLSPAPVSETGGAEGAAEDDTRRRRRRGRRGGRGRRGERRGGRPDDVSTGQDEQTSSTATETQAPQAQPMPAAEAEVMSTPPPPAMRETPPAPVEAMEPADIETRVSAEAPVAAAPAPARPVAEPSLDEAALAESGKRWTQELMKLMGFDAKVSSVADGDRVDVTVEVTERDDLLTGPKGEVRQAMQHILNRMVNRGEGSRYHLQLEINDFWQQREDELRKMSESMAGEAIEKDDEVVTEYLNSQERRIVHMTLREDSRVKTYALGSGMIKRVAIAPADFPEGERDDN